MWSLLCAAALVTAGPEVEVQTLTGDVVRGKLAELRADGVVVNTDDGTRSVAGKDLMAVDFGGKPLSTDAPALAWVELVDGSAITASEYSVLDRRAKVKINHTNSKVAIG